MAINAHWFKLGQKHIVNGDVTWKSSGGSTIKVALLTSSATIAQDTNEVWSDLSANEVSGTGYTAGGYTLTPADPASGSGSHQIKLDADDAVWTITGSLAAAARYAIIYGGASSHLLGYVDFDGDKNPEDGTLTITWDSNGILTLTAS